MNQKAFQNKPLLLVDWFQVVGVYLAREIPSSRVGDGSCSRTHVLGESVTVKLAATDANVFPVIADSRGYFCGLEITRVVEFFENEIVDWSHPLRPLPFHVSTVPE